MAERGSEFDGVIVDFDLNLGSRSDYFDKYSAQVEDPGGQTYPVSTGIGVLDFARWKFPDMPLWTLVDTSATHVPLYVGAANLWFDAYPLSIDWFAEDTRSVNHLVQLLTHPRDYKPNALAPLADQAKVHFGLLLDSPYRDVEALDWMGAMATLPGGRVAAGTGGFKGALQARVRDITGKEAPVHLNRLCFSLAAWQRQLSQIYQGFDVKEADIHLTQWPVVDEEAMRRDNHQQNLNHWNTFNPFTDFFGRPECAQFLTATDVREALCHYRERSSGTPRPRE